MKRKKVIVILLIALAASLSIGCSAGVSQDDFDELEAKYNALADEIEDNFSEVEANYNALADEIEIEKVIKTMVWSMDEGDMETWLSIFSEDVEYAAYNYGDETPLLPIQIANKATLEMLAPMMIFQRAEHTFSTLSNIQIEVSGDTATAQDYYVHYEYPIDPRTQKATEEHAYLEGMHFYELNKIDGDWKITKLRVVTYRKDALLQEMEQLMREALLP